MHSTVRQVQSRLQVSHRPKVIKIQHCISQVFLAYLVQHDTADKGQRAKGNLRVAHTTA